MNQTIPDPSDINMLMEEISNQSSGNECAGEVQQIEGAGYLQLTIHDIWSKMLGFSSFSLTDDLFDVGGDSVTAIQIFSEINRKFGIRLAMEELFIADTFSIEWLSELVERYLIELLGEEEFQGIMAEVGALTEVQGKE